MWSTTLSSPYLPFPPHPQLSSSALGATMVFQMTSQIVGRKPVERIMRNVHLYELESVQVVVSNPFPEGTNFEVRLVVSSKESSAENILLPEKKG